MLPSEGAAHTTQHCRPVPPTDRERQAEAGGGRRPEGPPAYIRRPPSPLLLSCSWLARAMSIWSAHLHSLAHSPPLPPNLLHPTHLRQMMVETALLNCNSEGRRLTLSPELSRPGGLTACYLPPRAGYWVWYQGPPRGTPRLLPWRREGLGHGAHLRPTSPAWSQRFLIKKSHPE